MNLKIMSIEYADPARLEDTVIVDYQIETHAVATRWAASAWVANKKYAIDEPDRFYRIGSIEFQISSVIAKINQCIDIVNNHQPIINQRLESIDDQDTLNYLHNIFEVYHGLMDQQTSEFWSHAPAEVRVALSRLNTLIHQCEVIQRKHSMQHMVTWYSCPKILRLSLSDLDFFKPTLEAGTVFLLYAEIGKTLDALAEDDDQYIGDDAFKPYDHYGPDFGVFLEPLTMEYVQERILLSQQYYTKHLEFFISRGHSWETLKKSIGCIPLARMVDVDKISDIIQRPFVKAITFS
jgi:hypothetical protein